MFLATTAVVVVVSDSTVCLTEKRKRPTARETYKKKLKLKN